MSATLPLPDTYLRQPHLITLCALQFTVNDIIEDSPAAFSQIRVGDRLRMVSSAFDGGAAAVQSHLTAATRHKERVRHLLTSLTSHVGAPPRVATIFCCHMAFTLRVKC